MGICIGMLVVTPDDEVGTVVSIYGPEEGMKETMVKVRMEEDRTIWGDDVYRQYFLDEVEEL